MPWKVVHKGGSCGGDKPWAVIKETDGSTVACHATKEKANSQVRALYASESNTADPADSQVTRRRGEYIRRKMK